MKEWLIFTLFVLAGLGMFCGGLIYRFKEKNDTESVKIYSTISIIGIGLTAFAVLIKLVF